MRSTNFPTKLIREVENEVSEGRSVMILSSCKYVIESTMKMLKNEGIPYNNQYKTDNPSWNPLRRGKKQVMGIGPDSVLYQTQQGCVGRENHRMGYRGFEAVDDYPQK